MNTDLFACKRFLIVDGNRHMRSLLRAMLQRFGVKRIDGAGDTARAFEALLLSPPDLVICDRDIGPVDGLDFIGELRAQAGAQGLRIPVILLLSRTDQATIMQAKAASPDHLLAKPVSALSLGQRISLCFAKPPESVAVR